MQHLISNLNIYDLYRPIYDESSIRLKDANRLGEVTINGEKKTYRRGFTHKEYTPWLKHHNLESVLLGEYVSDYMNR